MNADPSTITSAELAQRMGVAESSLWEWSNDDASLRGCILRRTRRSTTWSVQRLRERGFLTKPEPTEAETAPVLSHSWRIAL